ncbi:MAG: IclR family transcriptional regulator [Hyphomicrobiales bacterium]|nr:IclR family transcriptional regulator [Hyphomicrobiales bacterium]
MHFVRLARTHALDALVRLAHGSAMKKGRASKTLPDATRARRGIQSADRAVDVLVALTQAGRAATLKDIAELADMPASLAHRYLASLVARGLARQNGATGLYDFGPLAIRIGASAMARVDALALAGAAMPALADATGLTAILTILGDRGPTIVRWERSPMPFVTALAVGSSLPLTGSASGRVILAYSPERLRRRLIEDNGPEDARARAGLLERLAHIRAAGFDTADSTVVPGLTALCAPILDAQSDVVAALALIGATRDVEAMQEKALATLLDAAQSVSRECGGAGS